MLKLLFIVVCFCICVQQHEACYPSCKKVKVCKPVFKKKCNTIEKVKCSVLKECYKKKVCKTKLKKKCYPVKQVVCKSKFPCTCSGYHVKWSKACGYKKYNCFPDKVCRDVQVQKCKKVPVKVCKELPEKHCKIVKPKYCKSEPKKVCKKYKAYECKVVDKCSHNCYPHPPVGKKGGE